MKEQHLIRQASLYLALDVYRADPQKYTHLTHATIADRIVVMARTFEIYLIGTINIKEEL